ncbi:hypothetical protein SO802_005946 [Lithocarpus litseifolius]|uniref:Uncharacterized protein n=1 Tax=Lithocarpus litseifolius TaxID=425828 RepID=A0AAW2DML9_9ROSI
MVLGESLYISGKYLDYDKKLVEAQSRIASLSAENESLTIHISALANEAKKDNDILKTLGKNIDIKKAFSKLKDKQIDEALKKVEKAGLKAIEKFKASDEHHPEMDFSKLDMEEVENEILVDHLTEPRENEVVPDAVENAPTDLSPSSLP